MCARRSSPRHECWVAVIHDMENDGYDPIVYEERYVRRIGNDGWLDLVWITMTGAAWSRMQKAFYTTWHWILDGCRTSFQHRRVGRSTPDFTGGCAGQRRGRSWSECQGPSVADEGDLPCAAWGPPDANEPKRGGQGLALDQGGLPAVWQAVGAL